MPEGNAYRLLIDRLYSTVAGAGVRVLLTGAHADQALTGGDYWLAEHLRDGQPAAALAGLLRLVRRQGLTSRATRTSLVQVVSWLLDVIPGGRRVRPKRRPLPPPWLTPQARDILAQDMLADETPQGPRPGQADAILGGYTTTFGAMSGVFDGLTGVDTRYPYRDRRLVEFLMAIPAYELFDGRDHKLVVKRAMAGILPDLVLDNPVHGRLYTLYMRGVERERSEFERILHGAGALWQPYVEPDALWHSLDMAQNGTETGRSAMLPWFCAAVEMWRSTAGDKSAWHGWRPPRETIDSL